MSYIQSLSATIQEGAIDVVKAYGLVHRVADRLRRLRETVEETHDSWWKDVQLMATSLNVVEVLPRQCLRQVHRSAAPATSVSVHYRRNLTILLLDEIVFQDLEHYSV